MQVELLDRKRWNTRVELVSAIFEYLEIFHNRQRRHSSLGMLTRSSSKLDGNRRQQHESNQATPRNSGHPRASRKPRTVQIPIVGGPPDFG
jgi:putative transposase